MAIKHEHWELNRKQILGSWSVYKFWRKPVIFDISRKPNANSSLTEIKKFVYDKYVKKKYVDQNEKYDPLIKVKMGIPLTNE
jgi:hypothetical protein